ncbi:uncharacterized protein [Mytilus edulis]|uniref:uncharacterized protein n=1 Tax=Mytilus edulis TaxID=6550 RepID=UPI0039EE8083
MDIVNLVNDKKEVPRSTCERYSNFKEQLINLTDIASKAFKGVEEKLKENEKQTEGNKNMCFFGGGVAKAGTMSLAAAHALIDMGDSPMHQVASQGKCNMVKALASLGAKLSAINNEGDTPLHQAARHGKLNTVEHLVRLGANISATNYKGSSPLHQAASYGKDSTVETLVRLGADLSARNVEGKTPYELAEDGYVRNKNNMHAYTFQKIVDFLKENAEILGNSRENSSVASKILEINSDTSELPKGIQSDKTKENDIQLPWLVDAEEFKRMLSHGEYLSYDNLLSLGGPCRAGKSTLASVLIGEEIPLKWNSTDGLVIYFGRNGINIEKKEMIPLKKGERGHEVFSKILRGKPNFRKMSENDTKGQTSTLNKSGQSVRRNVLASALPAKHTEEVKNNTKFSRGKKASFSKTKSCPELLKPQILNADKPTVTTVIQSLEFQELQLQSGILEEVRNGEYKIGLAPSDLIDFGGQKSYDMTHQLFIQHRGSFLLMFDGRFGLHNQLLEYPEGVTAAVSGGLVLGHQTDHLEMSEALPRNHPLPVEYNG